MYCGHLLGKGWPLSSRLWCLTVSLSLSHWDPGSGVVLDCIDSWSLNPYLLLQVFVLGLFIFLTICCWRSNDNLDPQSEELLPATGLNCQVHVRNDFEFWNIHGIMNTFGLLQSKWSPKGFTLTLQETGSNKFNKLHFWNVHGIMNTSCLLQESGSIHDYMNISKM